MLKLDQISLPINYTKGDIASQICKNLRVKSQDILDFEILKLSVDARKKPNVKYVASVGVKLKENLEKKYPKLKFEKFEKSF